MGTALITGVFGQDGSLLTEQLLARGDRVVGIARSRAHPLARKIEVVELDLEQASGNWATDLVARVQPDEVYHLAAAHRASGTAIDSELQQAMVRVNVDVSLALANALLTRGCGKLVVALSSQMFEPKLPAVVIDEASPHSPPTFYGVTKATCRDALAWLRERQGLAVSCAILFNHESERRPETFVSRTISRAAARIAAGKQRTLELGDVWSRSDFSSARDIVDGLQRIAASDPADFVLGSGTVRAIHELCDVAFRAVGLDWRDHVTSRKAEGERPAAVADPRRAERVLGWRNRRPFETWMTEMVKAEQP